MRDGYGREINYLRLSVTELCNLRCRYCMPEEGICKKPHEEILTQEEMVMAVEAAARLGITKVRVTGGEPLVKKNILSLCAHVSRVPGVQEVCITTNGTLLPPLAQALIRAGVRRVNLSLDTLDRDKYARVTRRDQFSQAMEGLECAVRAGFERVKINTVLMGGFNDDEIEALAALTLKYPVDVRFIELMPMEGGGALGAWTMVPNRLVLERLPRLEPVEGDGGVASLYRLPGALGNIGLISPVSCQFCDQCNRIRLTADGTLKPCLHSPVEYSIKGLSREEMAEQFQRAILSKPPCHDPLSPLHPSGAGRAMNTIGG